MYAKGIENRERLLDSAEALLAHRELKSISLKEISEVAGVSTSSAYHFYRNADEVWAALAGRFATALEAAVSKPPGLKNRATWRMLWDACIDRAVDIYEAHPAYLKLILGGQAPAEIKLADRDHDALIGKRFAELIAEHVNFEPFPQCERVFFIAVEIVDLVLSLSVMREGAITEEMVAEAKRASGAYLESYLGAG